ncbi:MAG: FitA-like ribbon-helix-helix domain-containing protein [Terriglobia bacterium]
MPDLMVRNVPEAVYDLLKLSAKAHGRSLNAEVVAILADEDAWALRRLKIDSVLEELKSVQRAIHKRHPNALDSTELIRELRNGR